MALADVIETNLELSQHNLKLAKLIYKRYSSTFILKGISLHVFIQLVFQLLIIIFEYRKAMNGDLTAKERLSDIRIWLMKVYEELATFGKLETLTEFIQQNDKEVGSTDIR